MTLAQTTQNKDYTILSIDADSEGMGDFLRTLGCFPGEKVRILNRFAENYVICVRNARYSIDADLASHIGVGESTLCTQECQRQNVS